MCVDVFETVQNLAPEIKSVNIKKLCVLVYVDKQLVIFLNMGMRRIERRIGFFHWLGCDLSFGFVKMGTDKMKEEIFKLI